MMPPATRGAVVKFTDTRYGAGCPGVGPNFRRLLPTKPSAPRLRGWHQHASAAGESERRPTRDSSLGCACLAGLLRGDDIEILATSTAFFASCLFRTVCSGSAALQQKLVCRD